MAKPLLEKMFFNSGYSIAVLHAPSELLFAIPTTSDTRLDSTYHFILAFYTKKEDVVREVAAIKKALMQQGLLWVAYPKGKALQTNLTRDILHETMNAYGLDGVSIVSLDATWSAMRFKNIEH